MDEGAAITARGTVLVVEDEVLVQMLVLEVLDELGVTALEANDAASALEILGGDGVIDLLVTDVGLPGMNGRELAEAARQLRPDLRVLFVTGYAEKAADSADFLAPGMEMIVKPFALEQLSRKVAEMLAKVEADKA